jgi:hypothetical protein
VHAVAAATPERLGLEPAVTRDAEHAGPHRALVDPEVREEPDQRGQPRPPAARTSASPNTVISSDGTLGGSAASSR